MHLFVSTTLSQSHSITAVFILKIPPKNGLGLALGELFFKFLTKFFSIYSVNAITAFISKVYCMYCEKHLHYIAKVLTFVLNYENILLCLITISIAFKCKFWHFKTKLNCDEVQSLCFLQKYNLLQLNTMIFIFIYVVWFHSF